MRRACVFVVLFAAPAGADSLALGDGRFIEGKPIERRDEGYLIRFDHGDVFVPDRLVVAYHGGDEETFVPRTEEEKEKAAKGLVPWRGRWVRPSVRDREREKWEAERAERMNALKERRLWRNHVEVRTRTFVFRHTLPDGVFEELKILFETYYETFRKYWRISPASGFGTPVVNIYHEREYFEQVSGAPSGVVGYYSPMDRELHFYYDRENHDFTVDVMFHEGNHMLAHMIEERFRYPWWISEGMAEYFGASRWDPVKREMELGVLQSGRLAVLHAQIAQDERLSLDRLLTGGSMGAVEYAWAWSFCHFLLSTPRYADAFKKYFLGLARDSSIAKVPAFSTFRTVAPEEAADALRRYLRVKDLSELEKEWYAYIEGPLGLDDAEIDWGQAGYIMSLYGENAKARLFFKKAIDAGSKQAYVHYGYAELKLQQNMPGIARRYAEKAVELDPLHARAWCLQGRARMAENARDPEAMRLLELAHEMAPEDAEVWFALEFARQEAEDAD